MIQDSANASPPSIRSRARIAEEFALRMRQRTTVAQGIVVQSLHLHVLLEPRHDANCARKGRENERDHGNERWGPKRCHVAGINCSANRRHGRDWRLAAYLRRERIDLADF
jgi:hypothetical protein